MFVGLSTRAWYSMYLNLMEKRPSPKHKRQNSQDLLTKIFTNYTIRSSYLINFSKIVIQKWDQKIKEKAKKLQYI